MNKKKFIEFLKENWQNIIIVGIISLWVFLDIFSVWENISFIKDRRFSITVMIITTVMMLLVYHIFKIKEIFGEQNKTLNDKIDEVNKSFGEQNNILNTKIDNINTSFKEQNSILLNDIIYDFSILLEKCKQLTPHVFRDITEVYKYITKKIKNAEISIDDITWGSYTKCRSVNDQKEYDDFIIAMKTACQNSNLCYREVSSLSDEPYLSRSESLFEFDNYNLKYYNIKDTNIPLSSYIMIDKEEVILGFIKEKNNPILKNNITFLSTKDPDFIQLYSNYFDSLWEKGRKIKENDYIDYEKIKNIRDSFGN